MPLPQVNGFNATTIEIKWEAPLLPNGPPPSYVVTRVTPSFSHPPLAMERGARFPGGGYHLFPSTVMPQGVAFSGKELYDF